VDASGRIGWSQALANGITPAQAASAVLASPEYREIEVQSAYGHLLHRPAEEAGLNLFTAALAQGARYEQVRALIIGSPEYFAGM